MSENGPAVSWRRRWAITRRHGAEVVLAGQNYQETYDKAVEIQQVQGAMCVRPFDDAQIIAGQGTIGLELLEQAPKLEAVLVLVLMGGAG